MDLARSTLAEWILQDGLPDFAYSTHGRTADIRATSDKETAHLILTCSRAADLSTLEAKSYPDQQKHQIGVQLRVVVEFGFNQNMRLAETWVPRRRDKS
ncbi:hypothetical protein T265_07668 [Opisthorchis viverrini]|uniref:Uncharacterized protein n=1 Tax=Opisthorchis viverrini TaxID=6198 RepID=A0A074ZCA1_OPIVI|nr:hypothetical protein T265_07668 [Opisthorchis viverrini]KER24783.1 hypothetical protein T265_07668 [Opisthorchis viverrini]